MKGQGSLEYLIIIAAVLLITAVVVLVVTGSLGGQTSGYITNTCKQAAAECKLAKLADPDAVCGSCEASCTDPRIDEEIFSGAVACCRQGQTDSIYEGATACGPALGAPTVTTTASASSGQLTLGWSASDDIGLKEVVFNFGKTGETPGTITCTVSGTATTCDALFTGCTNTGAGKTASCSWTGTPSEFGSYTYTSTVTDTSGKTSTDSKTITVVQPTATTGTIALTANPTCIKGDSSSTITVTTNPATSGIGIQLSDYDDSSVANTGFGPTASSLGSSSITTGASGTATTSLTITSNYCEGTTSTSNTRCAVRVRAAAPGFAENIYITPAGTSSGSAAYVNVRQDETCSGTTDANPPVITELLVTKDPVSTAPMTFKASAYDSASGLSDFCLYIDGTKQSPCSGSKTSAKSSSSAHTLTVTKQLSAGPHTYYWEAKDASSPKNTKTTSQISIKPGKLDFLFFSVTKNSPVDVIQYVDCTIDTSNGNALSCDSSTSTSNFNTYSHPFNLIGMGASFFDSTNLILGLVWSSYGAGTTFTRSPYEILKNPTITSSGVLSATTTLCAEGPKSFFCESDPTTVSFTNGCTQKSLGICDFQVATSAGFCGATTLPSACSSSYATPPNYRGFTSTSGSINLGGSDRGNGLQLGGTMRVFEYNGKKHVMALVMNRTTYGISTMNVYRWIYKIGYDCTLESDPTKYVNPLKCSTYWPGSSNPVNFAYMNTILDADVRFGATDKHGADFAFVELPGSSDSTKPEAVFATIDNMTSGGGGDGIYFNVGKDCQVQSQNGLTCSSWRFEVKYFDPDWPTSASDYPEVYNFGMSFFNGDNNDKPEIIVFFNERVVLYGSTSVLRWRYVIGTDCHLTNGALSCSWGRVIQSSDTLNAQALAVLVKNLN